jgi:hypothetical protein
MLRRVVTLALLASAGAASAETGLSFHVSNTISPNHPSATVEVWAHIEDVSYAFAAVQFDALAAVDPGGFSDPFAILHTLGTFNGDVQPGGDLITHCLPGQIQAPVGEWFADTTNPILIWRATWSTDDFNAREVDISTFTHRFAVYLDYNGNNVLVDETLDAEGVVKVVPGPAVAALFTACGAFAGTRRRRN